MENKWWEYYAVRYFVGTVIGAGIVAFLNEHPDSLYYGRLSLGDESTKTEAKFLDIGVTAALGFAYCYIASAPVLTLHAARAHLRLSTLKAHWVSHIICLSIAIAAAVFAVWRVLPPRAAIAAGFVIGMQFGLVLVALCTKFSIIEDFYRQLAGTRSKAMPIKDDPPSAGLEYVTSYRHLREHGNAFMIVILEVILAYAIFCLPSMTYAFLFVAAWLLPATFAWFLGTVLESRLVSVPLP